jgi:hypothetical protein
MFGDSLGNLEMYCGKYQQTLHCEMTRNAR